MNIPQSVMKLFGGRKRASNQRQPAYTRPTTAGLTADQILDLSLEEMVGKSNKFDFSNRTSGGVRLGLVICETFRKEIGKAVKDAARQNAKIRKQSSESSSTSNSIQTGRDIGIHVIDLKAPSKNLGDQGLEAMVPGMLDAVNSSGRDSHICIEDINLQNNGLTVKALACLAPVIRASNHDLKTLNLSHNNIRVVTAEEARDFETFLRSFRCCFKLRRLDLSGNQELGAKAMEVLARVYTREEKISPLRLGGEGSVHSLENAPYAPEDDEGYSVDAAKSGEYATSSERKLANACILKRRQGIRSLPYLNLTDIGLDDTGALWLSFVLPLHYYPEQLIDGLNAAPANTSIGVYQQEHGTDGLDWHGNEDTLGRDGLQLLCKAEAIRKHDLHDCEAMPLHQEISPNNDADTSPFARITQSILMVDKAAVQHPVASIFDDKTIGEVNGLRSKMQRSIMQHTGVHNVDLWHVAVNLIVISRHIYIVTRGVIRRKEFAEYPGEAPKNNGKENSRYGVSARPEHPGFTQARQQNIRARPQVSELTKALQQQNMLGSSSKVPEVTTGLQKHNITKPSGGRYMDWQRQRMPEKENALPWVLPFAVFDNIAGHVLSEEGLDALTLEQRKRAHRFGSERRTLLKAREWRKLNHSAQLMMVLNAIQCLAYESQ